jgi:hypothetical protein
MIPEILCDIDEARILLSKVVLNHLEKHLENKVNTLYGDS